jgi:hypothetical protein
MLGFEALELPHEPVELGVGYFRVVEDVIALFMVPNEAAEFVNTAGRVDRAHRSRDST